MQKVLLDTDILSYFLRGDEIVQSSVSNYLDYHPTLTISIISYYEVVSGLMHRDAHKLLDIFEAFCLDNEVLPLTEESCRESARIYSDLRTHGKTVDDIDLLIAGLAISQGLVLVTNNASHFARIPNLQMVNWKNR
jgi:tRNA(fMet)-specific endonuclease VapC